MSNSAFTPAVLTVSSGTGSGSGEKNYITNPSMASATTGWNVVGDFTLTRTTAASELPREYTTGTGIKLVANNSTTQSAADYLYFDFNLDDVDLNRKLKIQWSQKKIGALLGTHLAVVITSQSDRTTALYTPVTSAIPGIDGDFQTSFDSASTAALSLVIRGTGTDIPDGVGICLSDVIVGPGEIVQGAAISEWQAYTPTLTNITIGNGTVSGRYRRVGSNIEGNINVISGTTTTYSSSDWEFSIPSGLNYLEPGNNTVETVVGTAIGQINDGSDTEQRNGFATFIVGTTTRFKIKRADALANATANFWNSTTTGVVNNLNFTRLSIWFSFPVSEWSGSGTVNLGSGAQVAYYYGTGGTWGTSATVTTAMGPGGVLGGTTTPANTNFEWTIVPSFPISTSSAVQLEFSTDGRNWSPAGHVTASIMIESIRFDGTQFIGAGAYLNTSGNIVVRFGKYPYGTSAQVWAGTWYWRVSVANPSSPVGFGLAGTDGSAGLYKPGSAPGQPNGSTIAAGYIGEQRRVTFSSVTVLTSAMEIARLTNITPGVYVVRHWMDGVQGSSTRFISSYNNGVAIDGSQIGESNFDGALYSTTWVHQGFRYLLVNSTIANYYLVGQASGANVTSVRGIFEAIRIA